MSEASDKQKAAAMSRGTMVRLARKKIRHEITTGERSLAMLLREDPVDEILHNILIGKLLRAMPRVSETRAEALLIRAEEHNKKIKPALLTRTLGEMTLRQRETLAIVVEDVETRRKWFLETGKRAH